MAYQEVIQSVWRQSWSRGSSWDRLESKLKGCIIALKEWQRTSKDGMLNNIQGGYDYHCGGKKLQTELQVLLDKEELWWH